MADAISAPGTRTRVHGAGDPRADALRFRVPQDRAARVPPEHRGLARDEVRLLVASPAGIAHARMRDLGDHLLPGDLLVVNTSATLPAALDGTWRGQPVVVHLSTGLDDGHWVVELRQPDGRGPVLSAAPGDRVALEPRGRVVLRHPDGPSVGDAVRLWVAEVAVPQTVTDHLADHGRPIAYAHAQPGLPVEAYQTVFGRDPGSAEMASAARPFSLGLVTDLVSRGVLIAPVTLHAGVSSLQAHEPPRPERYEVPATTAWLVNHVRATGGRVVAVGTTSTRALETVTDVGGRVRPGRGWTDLVLGPDRPARAVTGLLTGWHEPESSHLSLLEAVAGLSLVRRAYASALDGGYAWHEFGDSCLLIP